MESTKTTSETTAKKRQSAVGVVVSDKMDKTRVVLVTRYEQHPKYKKYIKHHKRFKAHDAKNEFQVGDRVRIEGCAPISRHKQWIVVEKVGTQDVEQYLKNREAE
ncbi:MAG: 30S ribosomal protein S17 [Candidatus Lloydbacteria bacterium RIFCSPHIGHO2_02_FULL_54_17]|uniref:Small ribosomal subunit protein uS17 n=1 Tax=Candidatus Lloydbacteria bacterium RIFCSPHIGHO2_02_FULL_54_17 TaxID=1798664 RepID=A0A1G2DF34_9BACT|nr:MAG: 30S ribosomal protein S17 [Candidatus Lloydbacteria bacterium RIFCSPHIGHO2_01_FULL_54_11]OGZ12186.1 MAG: 30S ribosomal protein S17 [Candidatus Lloydbacteria bacterium RIFCSPHIGHO2_02_FULL_54_17]OGZ12977.1 MAG: 30S ribosomal protein S17 [Candidatus Lloydbacteria bacterium RIFCSPLOWO2_01_FULL_54_18]OGZ15963.1 MAG: 30S ribosomal protein S17 [Candidatus Lloydbacteria bacterium RIFCSPLOWO2_02_FULL_54_12]